MVGVAGGQAEVVDRDQGLHDVAVEPLLDAVLWGETPKWERYVVIGTRPA